MEKTAHYNKNCNEAEKGSDKEELTHCTDLAWTAVIINISES